jgi:uncharacterized protein YcgL (UPF0745 family)
MKGDEIKELADAFCEPYLDIFRLEKENKILKEENERLRKVIAGQIFQLSIKEEYRHLIKKEKPK